MNKWNLKWETSDARNGNHNLLNPTYLAQAGISDTNEIAEISPYFAFPKKPYTEEGIASDHHPIMGSGGVHITTKDGRQAQIEELFYYDYGHKSGKYKDVPHYNVECRFISTDDIVTKTSDKTIILDHHIDDADHITISIPTPSGSIAKQKIDIKNNTIE